MGSKSSPSPPAAPDPAKTAAAQGAINKETAIAQANLNRINQYTPQGSLVYTQTGTNADQTPQYRQDVTFSPDEQQKFNLTNQAGIKTGQIANEQLNRLQRTLSQPINYDSAPGLQSSIDPSNPTYKAALDAQMQRVNPQIEQDRAALEQRLASQGITYGQEAYNNAYTPFNQGANDARSQAGLTAFQTALQNAQLGNTARQQSIQESASIRNQPLNEISALLSGTQVQSPQFSPFSQTGIQPADYTGAAALKYQGDLTNYNARLQSQNAGLGGLFGLGGSVLGAGLQPGGFLLGMSDIRLKRDIKPLGKFKNYPLYLFRYIWSDVLHHGVMAQEVQKIKPEAVFEVAGYLAVDYGML